MTTDVIAAIVVPSVAVIFNAGVQTQSLRQLKKIVEDQEKRLRNLENK